jgi:predicted metal-dependent peptidase
MSAKDSLHELAAKLPKSNLSKNEIENRIIGARVKMLMKQPFFGTLATRLSLVDASEWCPTAATDGRYFYYNRDFISSLSRPELIFLIGHEVLHCVYDHFDAKRRDGRHPMLWNIANDYVINDDLVLANVGEMIKLVKICWDQKYRGKSSEEVYDDLYKQMEKQGKTNGQHPKGFGKNPQGGGGNGDIITHGPNGEQSFDQHIEHTPKDASKDEAGEGNNDGTNGPIEYDQNEIDRMGQEFQNAVLEAAKAARSSKAAGSLPLGVERLLGELLEPQIDWRSYLEQTIKSTIKSGHTWLRPNRKAMQSGIYMPSMDVEESIDVAVCIDTSGSIGSEEIRDFFSEIHGIMTQYTDFNIKLWCFDTRVGGYAEFDPSTIDDLESYVPVGGGGTDFMVNWEFMRKKDIVPSKLIMFTDGYPCGSWGEENYCDVLFVIHGRWNRTPSEYPKAPFGVSVPYVREDA